MKPGEFRKLHINLPRQPVVNQRLWLIAGSLLVFIILLNAACNYCAYKKRSALPERQGKIALNRTVYRREINEKTRNMRSKLSYQSYSAFRKYFSIYR